MFLEDTYGTYSSVYEEGEATTFTGNLLSIDSIVQSRSIDGGCLFAFVSYLTHVEDVIHGALIHDE